MDICRNEKLTNNNNNTSNNNIFNMQNLPQKEPAVTKSNVEVNTSAKKRSMDNSQDNPDLYEYIIF